MVASEIARVEAAGGWVADGRVCDIIAVSRAFGDLQFKDEAGRRGMLQQGVEYGLHAPRLRVCSSLLPHLNAP